MKILAFAATSSSKSINKQLVRYTAGLLDDETIEVEMIDLIDYELPIFNEDREAELGQPELARAFLNKIGESDAIIISFAEYNGSYAAAYKNTFDWASRINQKVFQKKPMLLLATSPGPGGAASVLSQALNSAPYFDADVRGSLSVPGFYEHFDVERGVVTDDEINHTLKDMVKNLVVDQPVLETVTV